MGLTRQLAQQLNRKRFSFEGPEFDPRDLWLGVFWERKLVLVAGLRSRNDLHVYLTFVPCFPIHFIFRGKAQPQEGY